MAEIKAVDIKIKALFDFGEIVYVITDPMQYKGMVTRIAKSWNGGVEYEVSFDSAKDWYQGGELSVTRDLDIIPKKNVDDDED